MLYVDYFQVNIWQLKKLNMRKSKRYTLYHYCRDHSPKIESRGTHIPKAYFQ